MNKINVEVMRKLEEINRDVLLILLKFSVEDPKEEILDAYIEDGKKEIR